MIVWYELKLLILFYPNGNLYLDKVTAYIVLEIEHVCTDVIPHIIYHVCQLFSTCSLHELLGLSRLIYKLCDTGTTKKIRNRKILTIKKFSIGSIMYDVYLPTLKNNIYHIHYLQILLKNICCFLRHNAWYSKARSLSTFKHYAEITSTNFNLE